MADLAPKLTKKEEESTKRRGSANTTVKSLNAVYNKLIDLKMITEEERVNLLELKTKIIGRWLSIEMGITIPENGESTK